MKVFSELSLEGNFILWKSRLRSSAKRALPDGLNGVVLDPVKWAQTINAVFSRRRLGHRSTGCGLSIELNPAGNAVAAKARRLDKPLLDGLSAAVDFTIFTVARATAARPGCPAGIICWGWRRIRW